MKNQDTLDYPHSLSSLSLPAAGLGSWQASAAGRPQQGAFCVPQSTDMVHAGKSTGSIPLAFKNEEGQQGSVACSEWLECSGWMLPGDDLLPDNGSE